MCSGNPLSSGNPGSWRLLEAWGFHTHSISHLCITLYYLFMSGPVFRGEAWTPWGEEWNGFLSVSVIAPFSESCRMLWIQQAFNKCLNQDIYWGLKPSPCTAFAWLPFYRLPISCLFPWLLEPFLLEPVSWCPEEGVFAPSFFLFTDWIPCFNGHVAHDLVFCRHFLCPTPSLPGCCCWVDSPTSGRWFPHNGIPLAQRTLGSVHQRG